MKKRSRTRQPDWFLCSSPTSTSSSSSSSCIVDDCNNHQLIVINDDNGEENNQKNSNPPEPKRSRRKRVSINNNNKNGNRNVKADNPSANRRSSIYRGVTRHRWTGRFEAHLWDKSSWNNVQNKKGRQVYLGAYDSEVDAAKTYDLAALKYWGSETTLNFPIENYTKELEEMQNASKEEYLASLRRRSSGFSRGVSKYRGVARHHHNGRWEARIGRVFGNKYLYLGTFSSQEEAAAAYDLAAIEYRGPNAVTNFDISNYIGRVKNLKPTNQSQQPNPIQAKSTLRKKSQRLVKQHKDEEQEQFHDQQDEKVQLDLEDQVVDQQDQQKDVPCHENNESKLINAMDHPSMLMDDPEDDRVENPWSFCLDMGGYDPLLVPDIPFEEDGKLLDLDDTGFEENIDMIFDGEAENLISMDDTFFDGTEIGASKELEKTVGSFSKAKENSISMTSSSPSSPSSVTSLVSCQV